LSGGDLSRGGSLYRLNCSGCHGSTGRGGALVDTGENAPDLDELKPSEIATAIRSGPGPMPIFPPDVFDQRDLSSIVMFVETLQKPDSPGGFALGYRGPVTEGLASAAVVGLLALAAVWIERRGRG
jgi:ubiquinol-cytochrome c reductase cytochrome c subunit